MKKYIVALLFIGNAAFAQNTTGHHAKAKHIEGCPDPSPSKSSLARHHHPRKKHPMVMHEETIVVDDSRATAVVNINRGNIYVNDSLVAKTTHPKYEDYHIIINHVSPPPMAVLNENSFTGMSHERPRLGVYTSSCCNEGAMIDDVIRCSPADKAGLYPGDLITKIDSHEITGKDDLINAMDRYSAGDEVSVTYVHFGRTYTTDAKLAAKGDEGCCRYTEEYTDCGNCH